MKAISKVLVIVLMAVCVASCDQKWTQEEKENIAHFLKSLDLVIEAHSSSNKRGPGILPRQELYKLLSLYRHALSESNLVRDDVLDKAHPELKSNYRLYFQKGLELRVNAWVEGKTYDEIQGSALMDSWADWFDKNRGNIKIPR